MEIPISTTTIFLLFFLGIRGVWGGVPVDDPLFVQEFEGQRDLRDVEFGTGDVEFVVFSELGEHFAWKLEGGGHLPACSP